MEDVFFTLAEWHVNPGREAEFIQAWEGLRDSFSQLPHPPRWGRLLQSQTNPTLFYSFGTWHSVAAVEAMFANPAAQEGLNRVRALCQSGTPGLYKQVAEIILEK